MEGRNVLPHVKQAVAAYGDRVSKGLGLGLSVLLSLRAARVHTHHIYINATCKRHVDK